MKIAVMGTGRVGATLGQRWAQCGYDVVFGTRDPQHAKLAELKQRMALPILPYAWPQAADHADVLLLAVPFSSMESLVEQVGPENLAGKILVDCTNPLNDSFNGLAFGFNTSASEQIARMAPDARVVKAFNTVSAATMANPRYGDAPATLFYCGDDEDAKRTVHELAAAIDFAPVDAGPLVHARLLEPLAMLYIHLAFHGWGSNCALQIVKR